MANNTCARPPEFYQGDGITTTFPFPFPYFNTDDIAVFLWDDENLKYIRCTEVANAAACTGSTTEYYFTTSTPVELTFCVAPGLPPDTRPDNFPNVVVGRASDVCKMNAIFYPGTPIRAEDLNNNFTQTLLLIQEVPQIILRLIAEAIISVEQIEPKILSTDMEAPTVWDDTSIATSGASKRYFENLIQTSVPNYGRVETGKFWYQNDADGFIYMWDGSQWVRLLGDAAYKDIIDLAAQLEGPTVSDDDIFTSAAGSERFDTLVQKLTPPSRDNYQIGKTWLQNDVDRTLSIWDGEKWVGVASGGTFTTQPTTIYVDSVNGNDENDGHRIINPMRTIKAAVAQCNTETVAKTTNIIADVDGDYPTSYNNLSGLATFTTDQPHEMYVGTEVTFTESVWECSDGQLTFPEAGDPKRFVTKVLSPTSFEVQMEPSSKEHTYVSGGTVTGQEGFLGDGWIIFCAPGVFQEIAPISVKARNLSIVGASMRSTFIHPTSATELNSMFLVDSGFYLTQFTIAGLKAAGVRGSSTVDPDPTTGLPSQQAFVCEFRPGCIIRKSPYIQNCTHFSDESIDNDNFDPNNLQGEAGDVTSGVTAGGILCDGAVPALESPLRSFVVDAFTQIALGGPGILCTNNGYAQLVSFFGTFCWYHAKARNGGQLNLSNCTTDFGEYGLIADGKSVNPVVVGTVVGDYPEGTVSPDKKVEITVSGLTAQSNFKTNQPGATQVVTIGAQTYMVYKATKVTEDGECTITLLNPNPNQRNQDLGLIDAITDGATAEFRLQSYISTGGHTFEFVGSGTDYRAHPDYGGKAVEANQYLEVGGTGTNSSFNGGKVWLSATDEEGNFKVGDTFEVDQKTGFVTIDPSSVSVNVVADQSPDLGGDLDVNGYKIVGDRNGNDGDIVLETNANSFIYLNGFAIPGGSGGELPSGGAILTTSYIGTAPNDIPINGYLGKLAFVDEVGTLRPYFASNGFYSAPQTGGDIQFRYVSDTEIQLVMKGLDGTIRSTTLTLS